MKPFLIFRHLLKICIQLTF